MLQIDGISVAYGRVPAIRSISVSIGKGEVVAIIGANGAGKTTLLRTISGLLHPLEGQISFEDTPIHRMAPHRVSQLGIGHVPEGRQLFSRLSVLQNLELGAFNEKSKSARQELLEQVLGIFPILRERADQRSGSLSGGEQQMLAIGRALMLRPKLLMLDEPSLGLAPKIVERIFEVVKQIRSTGTTILLVEQRVREALELADRAYVLQTGRVVHQGTGKELQGSEAVRKAYLGI